MLQTFIYVELRGYIQLYITEYFKEMDSLRKQTRNRNILRIGVCCRDAAVVLLSFGRGKSKRLGKVQSFVTPNLERKGKDIYSLKKLYPPKNFTPQNIIFSETLPLCSCYFLENNVFTLIASLRGDQTNSINIYPCPEGRCLW